MDLKEILSKTRSKSEKVNITRTPPSIATEERPYSSPTLPSYSTIKADNKLATNRQQIGNKSITNWQQIDNKNTEISTNRQQTDNKLAAQLATIVATNWQQTDNKLATKVPFSALVGLQRAIVIFIYKECKNARSKITEALTLEYIASALKTSSGSVKTTLQRLEDKGCIIRSEFKNGRGGWSKYEIPDQLFRELLQTETDNKLATNWQQIDNKLAAQLATEPTTRVSSSSGSNNINTTTTEEPVLKQALPTGWEVIDIEPLVEIGFSSAHLVQIAQQGKLSAEMVQDSIYAFAFDLRRNNRASAIKKGSPLNFFMGILRNGQPYTPPENYESPQEEALRKYYEHKKSAEAKRAQMEQELMEFAFSDWFSGLSEATMADIVPPMYRNKDNSHPAKRSLLKEHFKNNEWPTKRVEILKSTS